MSNAFETYAERAAPTRPARPRREVAATPVKTAAEQSLEDNAKLLRGYKAWKRAQVEVVLAGPHGKDLRGLQTFLRTMTPSSAPALVTLVERAAWLRAADDAARHIVLGVVREGIQRLLAKDGREMDDALWGDEPTAYEQIRDMLRVRA